MDLVLFDQVILFNDNYTNIICYSMEISQTYKVLQYSVRQGTNLQICIFTRSLPTIYTTLGDNQMKIEGKYFPILWATLRKF